MVFQKLQHFQLNYFDQMQFLAHFVEEVNEIWYPRRAVVRNLRYQILFYFLYKMVEYIASY